MARPIERGVEICKAGGVTNFSKIGILTSHPNYGKPCVPVEGINNGKPIMSCIFLWTN